MKIGVTSNGTDLTDHVDSRFGLAPYLIIIETDTMSFESIEIQENQNTPIGTGIHLSKIIASKHQTDVIITGSLGPKAFSILKKAGIKVVLGADGTIESVVNQYKKGKLTPTDTVVVETDKLF